MSSGSDLRASPQRRRCRSGRADQAKPDRWTDARDWSHGATCGIILSVVTIRQEAGMRALSGSNASVMVGVAILLSMALPLNATAQTASRQATFRRMPGVNDFLRPVVVTREVNRPLTFPVIDSPTLAEVLEIRSLHLRETPWFGWSAPVWRSRRISRSRASPL